MESPLLIIETITLVNCSNDNAKIVYFLEKASVLNILKKNNFVKILSLSLQEN